MYKAIKLIPLLVFSYLHVNSQCTLNKTTVDNHLSSIGETWGIIPDATQGIPDAYINQSYSTTFTFKLPSKAKDVDSTQPSWLNINSIEVSNIIGLPPGMKFIERSSSIDSIFCDGDGNNALNCKWDGGDYGCLTITGRPLVTGNFPLYIELYGKTLLGNDTAIIDGYELNVVTTTNIKKSVVPGNIQHTVYPNPTNDNKVNFQYELLENEKEVRLQVYNSNGSLVDEKLIPKTSGTHKIEYIHNLEPGIYITKIKGSWHKSVSRIIIIN